jgi:CDP-diacylglycerol--glycerol-3-phosphate 3-phosphatidyltransferase
VSDAGTPSGAAPGDAHTFGPSALATPANALTVVRLLVSPLLFAMITSEGASWRTLVLWVVLASTDGVDGWIARKMGTTRSGAFLDPLADKVLVFGALCALAVIDVFWWLPVILIGARELAISLYRVYWGRHGLAVPARPSAKAKTVVQAIAVGCALAPPLVDQPWIAEVFLWASVVLALWSAVLYLVDGQRALSTMQRSER